MFVKEDIQQFAITTAVPASRNTTISCPFPIKKIVREGVTPYKITELPFNTGEVLFLFNEFLTFALKQECSTLLLEARDVEYGLMSMYQSIKKTHQHTTGNETTELPFTYRQATGLRIQNFLMKS